MKYSAEEIGKKIKEERLKLNWSQEAIGKELGQKSGAKQVSLYEKGITLPPIDVLFKLCEIFDCELGYLLGEEDYSSGTKLNTDIENTIGLNVESIKSLKHIKDRNFRSRFNPESYKRVLNNLISNPWFACLLDDIFSLDACIQEYRKLYDDIIEKYGEDVFNKASEYYTSSVDYIHDENAEKLDPIYYQAMNEIDSADSVSYNLNYKQKILRYEACESFSGLLNNICPKTYTEPN